MFSNMSYVYEVYKEGSFSKAADNLFISQPALSATVKRLKRKLEHLFLTEAEIPSGSQSAEKNT